MPYPLLSALVILVAYIIGGINGAIITSKNLYKRDIRDFGSGNPGLTNFYRSFGMRGTLLVIIIDVLKTVIPILIGWWAFTFFEVEDTTSTYVLNPGMSGRILAGLGVVLGHCFPVFYKFKGGKAVLALGTLLFIIDWRISIVGWGTFIIIVLLTRYVSLGAILGCLAYPAVLLYLRMRSEVTASTVDVIVAALCSIIIIARHHSNISRLLHGTERRFSFTRKKSGQTEETQK